MLVYGSKRNEEFNNELFSGPLEECMEFCKKLAPIEYYNLSICDNSGIAVKRFIDQGMAIKDFVELGISYTDFKKRNISGEIMLREYDSKLYLDVNINGQKVNVFEVFPVDVSGGLETIRKSYGEAATLYNKYSPDPIRL
ncbi:MAG: hypothetical protein K5894_09905 [Lachnospiraceae bacterium]|nr:hypothetical protein [Lachnospiraceae bacterium]